MVHFSSPETRSWPSNTVSVSSLAFQTVLVGTVGALASFYHDSLDINDAKQREISAIRLIAKLPTIAAMAYKYSIGQPFVYPKNDLDYTSNFLRMCYAVPCEEYEVNPVFARALDKIFILHADHEQNASTSTVRLAGSSGANPFACIAAGIACPAIDLKAEAIVAPPTPVFPRLELPDTEPV